MIENHPDVYLFAALAEVGAYTGSDGKVNLWSARRDQAIDQINKKEARSMSVELRTEFNNLFGDLRQ